MIIDCVMLCHELDMFELRLRLLWDHVDKFVVLESPNTHAGKPKPVHFHENRERFKWAESKLVHLIDERKLPQIENDFTIEKFQRECLINEAKKVCGPNDLIMVSDIDEIPSVEVIRDLKSGMYKDFPLVMKQDLYYYNIHCPRKKKWLGTVVDKSDKISPKIRDERYKYPIIETGWHLSYFMTPEDMAIKLKSFAHNNIEDSYSEKEYIVGHIKKNTNFLRKADGDEIPMPIPEYLMNELKKYPVFVGDYEHLR